MFCWKIESKRKHDLCEYVLWEFTSGSYFNLGRYEVKCPHRIPNDKDTSGSVAQETVEHYSSELLASNDGPSDMMHPENVGLVQLWTYRLRINRSTMLGCQKSHES